MSLITLAGNSPILDETVGTPRVQTQQDAYALLARGGFFYVGGVMIQPELITGVSYDRDSQVWTFERSGSPDVSSDPSDAADLGDKLAASLLLGHGSNLLNPWIDTTVVSVPTSAPVVTNISLQFTLAIHPRYVGVYRVRCYDAADDLIAYAHPYGASLAYTDAEGLEYGEFSGEFLETANPAARGLILDHDQHGLYPDNLVGGGTGHADSWPDTAVHRIEVEATPAIAPSAFQILNLPGADVSAGSVVLSVAGLTAEAWAEAGGVLSYNLNV